MKPQRLFATTTRILRQLRHDPRTIALALLVPSILMILLRYVFESTPAVFSNFAPVILGIFPFTIMFLIASISMLRERSAGTLERLMTLPLTKAEIIGGYALAFGLLAAVQSALASFTTLYVLDVHIQGDWERIVSMAILAGIMGMALGLFCSSLAKSEFQAVQFLPAFVFPQLLVCGLVAPFEHMSRPLQLLADCSPLYYQVSAMRHVTSFPSWPVHSLVILFGFLAGAIALAIISLRKSQ